MCYRLNPYLVRGLDYYTKTVFEIFEDTEQGRKLGALVGGGRFDMLVKLLGGKPTPACGAALGVERIIGEMKERKQKGPSSLSFSSPVFIVQLGNLAKRKSLKLIEEFRAAKIPIAESLSKDSIKTQLRIADKLGASYTLILGQKEALDGIIIVRDMASGKQDIVKLDRAVKEIKKRLRK